MAGQGKIATQPLDRPFLYIKEKSKGSNSMNEGRVLIQLIFENQRFDSHSTEKFSWFSIALRTCENEKGFLTRENQYLIFSNQMYF